MVDWYNTNWPYRKEITLTASHISGNHTDFPFLFNTTGNTDLDEHGHSGGKDLYLLHQMELPVHIVK